jgi:hypothetical protein
MTQREIVEALFAEEMAIDDFMADQLLPAKLNDNGSATLSEHGPA